ncbi:hypothetical protein EK21DRAFT_91549 [Setomelanomma holmii]|uniref:Uncharacterized protein n=1 Tax=Setomelanomma holmii TaxID=210430 RepID=A0A9P4H650_9PLEO|nr:hypothetical protein EK21DRAFT_91549 [Setomelanomma holmii]
MSMQTHGQIEPRKSFFVQRRLRPHSENRQLPFLPLPSPWYSSLRGKCRHLHLPSLIRREIWEHDLTAAQVQAIDATNDSHSPRRYTIAKIDLDRLKKDCKLCEQLHGTFVMLAEIVGSLSSFMLSRQRQLSYETDMVDAFVGIIDAFHVSAAFSHSATHFYGIPILYNER